MNDASFSCDIFCKIVDNFGDIGVCWRLATQLHAVHGFKVRLWVDDLAPVLTAVPAAAQVERQVIEGVGILHWSKNLKIDEAADLVIEAFACELPPAYIEAMAQRSEKPVWLNLEYLSAEKWVEQSHLLASPHPCLPLTKYFFFPGFSSQTGGLLRESDLLQRRARCLDNPDFRSVTLARQQVDSKQYSLIVSLFTYENAALSGLLRHWEIGRQAILCLIPEGRILQSLRQYTRTPLKVGDDWVCGRLTLKVIPFMMQADYDELLWACDVNFVRGEDSFVRAQWAARPFVWHVYPQKDGAHLVKLDAFLSRYLASAPEELSAAVQTFWLAWNCEEPQEMASAWPRFAAVFPQFRKHAEQWLKEQSPRDLASEIVLFFRKKAKIKDFAGTQR